VYTIDIKHRGDEDATTYTVYREKEAKEEAILYKYWRDADAGDYGISDDGYVAKVISRRDYQDKAGRDNVYLRFPWGYTFFCPKYSSKPLKVKGRKTNVTQSGKTYIEVQSKQSKMQALAMMFAVKPDYDLAIEWVLGEDLEKWKRDKWTRTMKTETFKGMVREELGKRLTDHGLDEDFTLDLLKEAIEIARDKKETSNLLKAVDNLQDMHGMKDKHLVKTVDKIEGTSTTRLIDELVEEEKHLVAQRTTIENKGE
tara:strand:+ start:349 stop:1116 length:768 start_codon:yes stop_codon:yes gene_type:complete